MAYDLIIIGGGPAGITAGIYGARKALKVFLITKDFVGQAGKASLVENYPGFAQISGIELAGKFKEHLKKFPVEIKEGDQARSLAKKGDIFEIQTIKGEKYQAKAVIVATGRNPRPLKVPGEAEFEGRGVSICSTCDAPLSRGKTVAVIGGGNAGFEAAVDLLSYAEKVYILEISSKIIADEVIQKRARKSGKVEIILKAQTLEIKGNKWVEALVYRHLDSGKAEELAVQGVFIEVGSLPATDFLKNLVDFNQTGEIIIDSKTCATKTPGLFAAGDATDVKYKQIVVAAGEGAKAALSAYNYLQGLK